jgi:hypothetical protein
MREKFNFTAKISSESLDTEDSTCPCKIRFREVTDIKKDQQALCQFCQIHKCSRYCMRTNKNMQGNLNIKSKKNRTQINKVRTTQLTYHIPFIIKSDRIKLTTTFSQPLLQKNRRMCRMRCGIEQTPDKCDTPVWKLRELDVIENDV